MRREITRRDFLDGMAVAVGVAAAPGLPSLDAARASPAYYPPALTGMRGSARGSFEVAHALRASAFRKPEGRASAKAAERYDLVVVGAGLSGLAAAHFYRQRAGRKARILILDNHDDFGGHARRNEFRTAGHMLVTHGGTYAIESPTPYSAQAAGLLAGLGVDPWALAREYGGEAYDGLDHGCFFDRETFGADRLVAPVPGKPDDAAWRRFLADAPLSGAARDAILRIETEAVPAMRELSQEERKARLSRMSYRTFLVDVLGAHPDCLPFYQRRSHDLYGLGIDAVPALDCWGLGYPGFGGLELEREPSSGLTFTGSGSVAKEEKPFFHFPDGNATIARLLVRSLIPGCAPGNTAEDIVGAPLDYARLDERRSAVRIRLNSTVVHAAQLRSGDPVSEVEVFYSRRGVISSVRAGGVVLACWNSMIPYLCPQLPQAQKEALAYGVKVPLVYTAVAVRSGAAFRKLGIREAFCPGMFHTTMYLDPKVAMGSYRPPPSLDAPSIVRMIRTPCRPGLAAREQQKAGRAELLRMPFEEFEENIREQLARVLGPAGFDANRDIDAITVNRWPHGYAYEYNPLWDPDWPMGQRPCDIARKPFGRITIANSDAAAAAYSDHAIDQAWRAVGELLEEGSRRVG
jgi:spermidine dehydrogenase